MDFRQIRKVGRANAVFVPNAICRQIGLQPSDHIAIFVQEDMSIVIKKVNPHEVSKLVQTWLPKIDA